MSLGHLSQLIGNALLLTFVAGIPTWATIKKVNVFEQFIVGAQEGWQMGVRLVPYLVAFMVAISMFRAAGGFDLLTGLLAPGLQWLGIPAEIVPMALVRPFSGSASSALLSDLARTHGADSWLAYAGATLLGSTETTLYVVMIYFAAVKITRTRHAIVCGLLADLTGVIAACWITRAFLH